MTRPVLVLLLLAACQPAAPPPEAPAAPLTTGTLIDLTHAYDEDTIYWPTADGFQLTVDFRGEAEGGYHYEANSFSTAEHGGTHIDAPVHFAEGRETVDAIPLEHLVGPAVVIDVTEEAADNPDYLVRQADFERWEEVHGPLPDGIIVLIRTGYGAFWPDAERYMGTVERGPEAVAKLHFPGLEPDAARWLVEQRAIHAIGLDTPSIDYGQSTLFEAHRILFDANIPAFENVANLDRLPDEGFMVVALPMKIRGGSGAPLRIIAMVP